jgi:hypothetical protein
MDNGKVQLVLMKNLKWENHFIEKKAIKKNTYLLIANCHANCLILFLI